MRRSTRARVKSATRVPPARFSATAHAAAVEPVVITSSISRMRLPATAAGRRQWNAPETLLRRAVLLNPACVAVEWARLKASITGMPVRTESVRASNID